MSAGYPSDVSTLARPVCQGRAISSHERLVNVANLDIQSGDSLRRNQRATVNLERSPMTQVDIVLEFLTGVAKDGQRGASSEVRAGRSFRF